MINKRITYFNKTRLSYESVQYVLRICGVMWWASVHSKDCTWFRLFGRGLMLKHIRNRLRFSERYGYKKYLRVGNWVIEYLK